MTMRLTMESKEFPELLKILDEATPTERVVFLSYNENDDQQMRANKFLLWWFFYFRNNFRAPLAPFHYDWLYEFAWTKNLLIIGFRWSIKTEMRKAHIVRGICYKEHSFRVWQSFDWWASEWHMRNIAKMLRSRLIRNDYWELFKLSWPRADIKKRAMENWNTENGIRMSARSLWEKLRWEWEFDEDDWASKPDDLTLDDIDVTDSVRNIETIDKNVEKLSWETIWAMNKEYSRIVFLWNVINDDWVVPRFEEDKKHDSNWAVFRQSLFDEKWDVTWDYFTPEMIKELRSKETEVAFWQNYELIPRSAYENGIIKEHEIRYFDYVDLNEFDELFMHSDTTHTWKQTSDYACTTILWMSKKDKNFYLIDFFLDKVDVEIQARTAIMMYIRFQSKVKKMTYDEKSNQGFWFWIKKLAKEEYNISLPIEELKYPNDKVTHFEPHVPHFRSNRVYLPSNHKDIKIATNQLKAFPNKSVHDDFVDWLSWVLDNFSQTNDEPQVYFL